MKIREWMEIDEVTFNTWSRAVAFFAKHYLKMDNDRIKAGFKKETKKGMHRFYSYYIKFQDEILNFKDASGIHGKKLTLTSREYNGSYLDSNKGLKVKYYTEEDYELLLIPKEGRYFILLLNARNEDTEEES